ncbi:hypothetical protein MES4922_10308 [Mesorhizobium ventifaucium]|uniref:Uncharacterized protein n=1 Tax=Mesorhizobium ventifaucium TaxID=666020 RepID=A0ABN8J975_9HYPH|nr:hypothetical protein MES4922_10308 [Mesorhizobium ventifaucium]
MKLLSALLQAGRKGTGRRPCAQALSPGGNHASDCWHINARLNRFWPCWRQTQARLDPVKLLREMRSAQQRLVDIADGSCTPALVVSDPALDQFLSVCGRPGRRGKSAQPQEPSRSKSGVVGDRIRCEGHGPAARVFDEEPWRTSRELLVRLQEEQPGQYPDQLLRTLQRRFEDLAEGKRHTRWCLGQCTSVSNENRSGAFQGEAIRISS